MLRITITLDSALGPEHDRELGWIEIVNDGTGTEEYGNYDVHLYSRKQDGLEQISGRVSSFLRTRGPLDLLHRAIHDVVAFRASRGPERL